MPFLDFTDETIKWYTSYSSNKKIVISMENAYSEKVSMTCGVSQGSILGPLLFSIYLNDMLLDMLLLYADDTCLAFQHKVIKTLEQHLNRDFSTLINWFIDNKLSVYFVENKTISILFPPKHRSKSIGQIGISYKIVKIKQYSKVTYLGCVLDEYLTGEYIARQVCTKNTSKPGCFRKT